MAIEKGSKITADDIIKIKDVVNDIIGEITKPTEWTLISQSIFTDKSIYSICYGDGKFIAIDASNNIAYSQQNLIDF